MKKGFKIEIRKTCKICGAPVPSGRWRTYCSKKCRDKNSSIKIIASGYNRERQRVLSGKYESGKLKCAVCGKWYIQVASHVCQIHGLSAREYKEYFDLPVSRGVVPWWYRDLKGKIAKDNQTFLNLKNGSKFQFKKKDDRINKMKGYWAKSQIADRIPIDIYPKVYRKK
jgi:hypothetical protein